MIQPSSKHSRHFVNQALIWLVFAGSFWLVITRMFGPNFALIPGDLGDARFNNYILEHFFRWLTGLDKSYWNASFFYPYSNNIAFSDNLLGSAPFYVLFRFIGLDRESAFQGWFVTGFILNFASAAFVLLRLKLKSIAVGMGAFFFTLGLPFLAQETHAQLLYRFCIPLACYWLWRFSQEPRLFTWVALVIALVWQFFLSIYLGIFLILLLVAMTLLIPLFSPLHPIWNALFYWPKKARAAWQQTHPIWRFFSVLITIVLSGSLIFLLRPYYIATKVFGFSRSWDEVTSMLPHWQSYLIADNSQLWHSISASIPDLPMRSEQQLFPGLAVLLIILIGLFLKIKTPNRNIAWIHLLSALVLSVFTFYLSGFSLYRVIAGLPGINSIRAVSRIELVLMWPVALFIAYAIDALLRSSKRGLSLVNILVAGLLVLLIAETALYTHQTFSKADAQARIITLRNQIPSSTPDKPILFLASQTGDPWWMAEIDAMLLSQDLGWPTLNGYSGNYPPNYGLPTITCNLMPQRIYGFMQFFQITDPSFYTNAISRVVPIGFKDCDPNIQKINPLSIGPFPADLFSNISLHLDSISTDGTNLQLQVVISNQSSYNLPWISLTGNPFRLSWRYVRVDDNTPISDFVTRQDLSKEIPQKTNSTVTISAQPPPETGRYHIEVTAVQEHFAWFYDRRVPIARSNQIIEVDLAGKISILPK